MKITDRTFIIKNKNGNTSFMRAVLQRVTHASVHIDNQPVGKIEQGLLILLGIEEADTDEDVLWLCRKIAKLRIFADEKKPMNIDLKAIDGEALIVSQFTLHASIKKGNRPSFIGAAKPETALPLYEKFIAQFEQESGKAPATGKFGADMQIELGNDGPVTIVIDSKRRE